MTDIEWGEGFDEPTEKPIVRCKICDRECEDDGWIEDDDEPELTDEEQDQLDEFYDREEEFDITDGRWQYPNGNHP